MRICRNETGYLQKMKQLKLKKLKIDYKVIGPKNNNNQRKAKTEITAIVE